MGVRNHHNRYSHKSYVEGNKTFFYNNEHSHAAQRNAAKRFVLSGEFTLDCAYYDCVKVDNHYQFIPIGNPLS